VVALLAFDYEADFQTNARIMENALPSVKTIEVTHAVRATKINGLRLRRRQPIALLDDELIAAGETNIDVVNKVLSKLNLKQSEVITIYYGAEAEVAEAEQLSAAITEKYPHLQVETIRGGQPYYSYIISIE
jgi:dihydroxyacetone kinase-like predicted kinase